MALNWDVTEVKDHEEVLEGMEWSITEIMIWYTIAIDLGEITDENAGEFFQRISIWERIMGPAFFYTEDGDKKDRYMTLADVKRRVGLSTNVVNLTRSKWNKRIMEILNRDAESKMYREEQKMEEAIV
jgi:hypothetical protein